MCFTPEIYQAKESELDFFNFLDRSSPEVKILIIQNTIIPLMNFRRAKTSYLKQSEIHIKLNRPASSGKAGEKVELWHELLGKTSTVIDPELACELADIAYYGLQPNASQSDNLQSTYKSELIEFVGIPIEALLNFCILKYSTRLIHGDATNYKQIEFNVLNNYLNCHPDIKNMWCV